MKAHRRNRLIAILGTVFGVGTAIGIVLYSLSENINLFYKPSDIRSGTVPIERTIKVGGLVVPGSVKRDEDSLEVQFTVRDNEDQLDIVFADVLPDLFKEGQGIVATGKLQKNGVFLASSVLAKHDENYMPPEVARALEETGHPIKNDDFDQ